MNLRALLWIRVALAVVCLGVAGLAVVLAPQATAPYPIALALGAVAAAALVAPWSPGEWSDRHRHTLVL